MKMEAADSFDSLVTIYQSTWRHVPVDSYIDNDVLPLHMQYKLYDILASPIQDAFPPISSALIQTP
jgi:hypothetical protein